MRQSDSRWLLLTVVLLFVGITSFSNAVDEISGDYEDLSVSGSDESVASVDENDRTPCSFRGGLLLHKEAIRLDPCTECSCNNGTTTCNIESCPSEAGCSVDEIVIIPQECCPQCPYKMIVIDTNIMHDQNIDFTIGETERIRFGLDVEIERKLTSRYVRGEDLWKLSTWVSTYVDGSGPRYSLSDNVLGESDASKQYFKPDYPPWQWNRLRTSLKFKGGTCEDFQYFCVEFGEGDNPKPTYDLDFTMGPLNGEQERLRDCKPLGTCVGGQH